MDEPRQAPPTAATNPFLSGNFAPVEAETTCLDLEVHGKIPEGLDGRFLRIGPNPIGPIDPLRFHWFVGTGIAHGLRLRGGGAEWYRSRFVLDANAAEALGCAPIPGPGAGGRDGVVNTHFTTAAGKLYALVEAGSLPIQLDDELGSVARSDFGGTLEAGFTAHPRYDPATGLQHAIVYEPGLPVRYLTLDAAGRASTVARIDLPHTPMIHDVAFTASSIVVLDLPVTFALRRRGRARPGASGRAFPGSGTSGRPPGSGSCRATATWGGCDGSRPRAASSSTSSTPTTTATGPSSTWSATPGCSRPTKAGPTKGRPCWPAGRSTGRAAGSSSRSSTSAARSSHGSTAPSRGVPTVTVTPRIASARAPHRAGRQARPGAGLVRGPRLRPRPRHARAGLRPAPDAVAEDEGWILSYVYDAGRDRSDVVILDARDFGGDPIATIRLPVRVPYGFHGGWVPDGSPIPPVA